MKIIVVEDEIRSREGLVNLLGRLKPSYRVIATAENGCVGLGMIKKHVPDLVITDIKMPIMDGLSMIKQMRQGKIMSQVIILSAFADFSYAQKAISFGVTEYILKPISVNYLIDVLAKIDDHYSNKEEMLTNGEDFTPLIQRVCDILSSPLSLNRSLGEISLELKITPEYLGTQFYKEVGCHFSVYIKNKRLAYAKNLLKNTNVKVSDIAAKVGYSDAKYFSQLFKKELGCLPVEYRRQNG